MLSLQSKTVLIGMLNGLFAHSDAFGLARTQPAEGKGKRAEPRVLGHYLHVNGTYAQYTNPLRNNQRRAHRENRRLAKAMGTKAANRSIASCGYTNTKLAALRSQS